MAKRTILKVLLYICISLVVIFALTIGISVGAAIAEVKNTIANENFLEFDPALPSKVVDINGRVITQFYSDEKREIVSIKELPQHLIDAVITREDQSFWKHHGFTLRGYFRALLGILLRKNMGGGSTITLQLAGTLYANRREISLKRKLVELWWALQLERRYTKEEILEMYLNRMIMGPGVYGVEAASQYYFGHSARDINIAESAILVIQLSSPTTYNPYRNPGIAKARSKEVLDQMVKLGYVDREKAEDEFLTFWDNYDYTRAPTAAFYNKDDKAPWFSEYVRRELENILYGSIDIYKDGLTIYTTLNLDYQQFADAVMTQKLKEANDEFKNSSGSRNRTVEAQYLPIVEMLGLVCNLEGLFQSSTKIRGKSFNYYYSNINPTLDAVSLLFNIEPLKTVAAQGYAKSKLDLAKSTVEGALISIDNETGYIVAMVGGSQFNEANQLIRATQAQIQPGSAFKPLMYSAAIDSKLFTEGTVLYDAPKIFVHDDGTEYTPSNYSGTWLGPVLLYSALARSLNIPAIETLQRIGFDATINRAAMLLGITDPNEINKKFPRRYALALGIISVSPLQMARAFAVFANQGKEVIPIAIRSVEDRYGKILAEPEKNVRLAQKKKGTSIQLISPQNAFIMMDMLKRVTTAGTLMGATQNGQRFTYTDPKTGNKYTFPVAGKTGTTQNWADAWVVGLTPYHTTAIWFGFDEPGNSLGSRQTGAAIAGFAWADYSYQVLKLLPYKNFSPMPQGIVQATVCRKSGLLPTEYCKDEVVSLYFLAGTQPTQYCDYHTAISSQQETILNNLKSNLETITGPAVNSNLELDPEIQKLLNSLQNTTPSSTDESSSSSSVLD